MRLAVVYKAGFVVGNIEVKHGLNISFVHGDLEWASERIGLQRQR